MEITQTWICMRTGKNKKGEYSQLCMMKSGETKEDKNPYAFVDMEVSQFLDQMIPVGTVVPAKVQFILPE